MQVWACSLGVCADPGASGIGGERSGEEGLDGADGGCIEFGARIGNGSVCRPLCVYSRTQLYVRLCACPETCVCACVCMLTSVYMYLCASVSMHVRVSLHGHVYPTQLVRLCACVCTRAPVHACPPPCVCVCVFVGSAASCCSAIQHLTPPHTIRGIPAIPGTGPGQPWENGSFWKGWECFLLW